MKDDPNDSADEPEVLETDDSSTAPEGEGAEQLPDDPEVLKKRLKDTQAAFHKTRKELSETSTQLAKLTGVVETLKEGATPKQKEEIKDWLDEEFKDEDLAAYPGKVKDIVKRLRGEVGGVLKNRDEWLLQEVERRVAAALERGSVPAEAIAKLREDPDYEGFSDEQLTVIAKKQSGKTPSRLPAPVGGGRAVAAPEKDITKSPLYQRIYGEEG